MIENVQDELYQLENKGHSSNPKDILKSVKKLWKFLRQGDNFQSCNGWIP